MAQSKWATSTSARSPSAASSKRRRAPRTTPARRSGRTSLMTIKVIFGVWGAWFMKCARFSHRSGPTIWINYSNASAKAEYLLCLLSTQKTSCSWLSCACSWIRSCAPTVVTCLLARNYFVTPHHNFRLTWKQARTSSWLEQFECPEISARSPSVYRLRTTSHLIANQVYRQCDRTIWTHRASNCLLWAAFQVPQSAAKAEVVV